MNTATWSVSKKQIEPYVVPINQDEAVSYDRLRIQKDVALAD